MRIINLDEFLTLPVGSLFCKYRPAFFEEISIFHGKNDDWSKDFVYSDLVEFDADDDTAHSHLMDAMVEDSSLDVPLSIEETSRDGFYNDDQLFLVFSKEDLKLMAQAINTAIEASDDQEDEKEFNHGRR
jgi:hypothetical protein